MQRDSNNSDSGTSIALSDVVTSYRRYAQIYDRLFGAVLEDGRSQLIRQVERLSPLSIIELGVGTGLLLPRYPERSKVLGVDISQDMLNIAQRRIETNRLVNASLRKEDCENLTCFDGSFDCVVLPYVLSVTPNPQRLIDEAIRICAPRGRVVIVNHFSGSRRWALAENIVSPLAALIGFRSAFSYDYILKQEWSIEHQSEANIFGLSKVIVVAPFRK